MGGLNGRKKKKQKHLLQWMIWEPDTPIFKKPGSIPWRLRWLCARPRYVSRSQVVMWLPGQSKHQGSQVNGTRCSTSLPGCLNIPGTGTILPFSDVGSVGKKTWKCLAVFWHGGNVWIPLIFIFHHYFTIFTPSPSHCHHGLSFLAPIGTSELQRI